MKIKLLQYLSYLIIIVISIAIVHFLMKEPSRTPKGIILPNKQTRPASDPSVVTLYDAERLSTTSYTLLGEVRVEAPFSDDPRQAEQATFVYARQLAATVGANGLLIEKLGASSPENTPRGLNRLLLTAQAIYTRNE